ncbi:uncharacterized protein LOC144168835 [Haemaphysalis longicornis]
MLRSSSLLVVLVAGLALSLDLEAIQRSAHFPASPSTSSSHAGKQHHWGSGASKRASVPRRLPEEGPLVAPGGAGGSAEERLYYRLLSARMARLLPTLLGEQQPGYPSGQVVPAFFDGDDDDGSAASHASGVQGEDASGDEAGDEQEADEVMMYLPKRRVIHTPTDTRRKMPRQPSFAGMDSGPVYGIRKRVPAMKRRLRIQVAREEKRKRSTRRQLKDFSLPTEAAPLRRSKVSKTFGKKKTASALKDRSKPSRSSSQLEKGSTAGKLGNSTAVHKAAPSKVDNQGAAAAGTSAGKTEGRKYHIMKRSSDSTDEKVTGELRNIFGDDDEEEQKKRSEKKTVKKRENTAVALKGSDDAAGGNEATSALSAKDGAGPTTDEDKFKKWLLDEYYRTMALSFASMRRKRMATHRDTLDLRQVKRTAAPSVVPVSGAAEEQFEAVEDKLRNIEDAMIAEAVALVRDGATDEAELRAINAGVASRLDAAYDLENVRQSLDHLQGTLDTIRQQELQAALSDDDDEHGTPNARSAAVDADQVGEEDVEELAQGSSWAQLNDKRTASSAPASKRQEELLPESAGCPGVEAVSSSCPAAVLSLSPVPALQRMLLDACQWHQICYICGSYYGLGPEECESGTGGSGSSQFTRLLVSELLLRQGKHGTAHTTCGEPCVAEFLLNH